MPKGERRKEGRDGREGDSRMLTLLSHETLGNLGLGVCWHVKNYYCTGSPCRKSKSVASPRPHGLLAP